jgi:spore coat protein U-like protein
MFKAFRNKIVFSAAAVLAVLAVTQNAQAQTASLGVSSTVSASCSVSTSPLSFGAFNPSSGTATSAAGVVTLGCTTGSIPKIALDSGANASGAQRRLLLSGGNAATAGETINYSVFQPSAFDGSGTCGGSTPWVSGTAYPTTAATSATARNFSVCGVIPTGQTGTKIGSFSDSLTATITF